MAGDSLSRDCHGSSTGSGGATEAATQQGPCRGSDLARHWAGPLMGLALVSAQSVHAPMAQHLIYVRRSYKEATAADVSDEMQEAACRALLPASAAVRVISDSGGHQS